MKKKCKEIISFRIYYFLLMLLGLYVLPGCKIKNGKTEYTIGFSQCVGSDQWRKTMLEEMKRELSFHPELKLIYTNAENSSATQVQQVRSMLRNKIDLLIISPNEARPLTPIVEEAFSQGIPVIVIDRKTSSSLYTAYVGADNFEIGKIAGAYLVNQLDESGSILEVMGLSGSSPAIERQRGFYNALKNYPNIRIVKQVYGNWLINEAEKEVNKIGVSSKQIDAVFAHNDQMALGSYRALKRLNPTNKIKIIGVDALPDNGLKYVADNIIDASMLYPTGGKEAIRTAFSILNKEPFDKENILKTVVIDSSNVQLMKMQSDKLNSQYRDIERQQGRLKEQEKVFNNQRILLNILVISLV
ncbi:MAG: substrate-binding domain-containing protein, partial [Daejeonella sp.]